jgi:hypothetical protein
MSWDQRLVFAMQYEDARHPAGKAKLIPDPIVGGLRSPVAG